VTLIRTSLEFVRKNDFLILIYCAIGISLPFSIPLNGFFLIFLFVYSLYDRWNGQPTGKKGMRMAELCFLILFFLMYVIGLLRSWNLSVGFSQVEKIFSLIIIPVSLLVAGRRFTVDQVNVICSGFIIACLIISVVCYGDALYNIIHFDSIKVLNKERDYYYFTYIYLTNVSRIDPIYLSLYCNFSVLYILTTTLRKTWKIFLVTYLIIFILLISSKIGILCLLLTLLLTPVLKGSFTFRILALSVTIVAVVVVSVSQVSFLKQRFLVNLDFDYRDEYSGLWSSFSQRLAVWSCAKESIEEAPLFLGYGTGNGNLALFEKYKEKGYIRGFEDHLNAHNEFIQTFLDIGIIGLSVLLIMLLIPLRRAIQSGDLLVALFLLMMTEYFLVESILSRQKGVVFFAFFYALLNDKKTDVPET